MSDLGEAFVRIRPLTSGFTAEAEGGVAKAGKDLGKAFAAAFAVGGVAETVKSIVEAATSHQAAFAVLETTVKNAGASNTLYGQSLEGLLEKEARLKGFSDEELAAAFQRLVSVTHDSKTAFKDLGEAEDLARFRHIDIAAAALALSKAEQGNANSLQRYGIVVQHVTVAQDALKQAHDRAIAAGAKFTETDKEAYKAALAAAKATDQRASSVSALGLVEQRVGGSSAKFAETASGQFDRLKQDFHQFEVAIGGASLGGLASGAESLGKFLTTLTESGKVQKEAAAAAHQIGLALHDVGVVAKEVGPPLLTVAHGAEQIVAAIGAPALLAAVGTYKGLAIASGLAATAEAFYARAVKAGIPVTAAATVANAELAASEAAVAGAGEAATVGGLGAFGRGVFALSGGPLGLAVIGITALAGGIAYLASQENEWDAANRRLSSSTSDLTNALDQQKTAVGQLAQAAASRNAATARGNEAQSVGNLAAAALHAELVATNDLRRGIEIRYTAEQRAAAQTRITAAGISDFTGSLGQQVLALGKTNPLLSHNLELIAQLAQATGKIPTRADITLLINNQDPKAALAAAISGIASLDTFLKGLVSGPSNDIPSLVFGSGKFDLTKFNKAGSAAAQAVMKALSAGIATDQADLADIRTKMSQAITQGAEAVDQAVQSAKQNFNTIGQSLASSISAIIDKPLTDAQNRLTFQQDRLSAIFDAKNAALQAQSQKLTREQASLAQASAEKNLKQLGQGVLLPGGKQLSSDPEKAIAQLEALDERTKKFGRPALENFIIQYRTAAVAVEQGKLGLVQSGIDARRSTAETAFQLQSDALKLANDGAGAQKQIAQRRIADLTDEFNKHTINYGQFQKRLTNVLTAAGVDRKKAVAVLGVAGADQFSATLEGFGLQAAASAAGPQRPGSGLIPSIVRPLETLQSTQQQIAGIAKEQRTKQLDETKKHTKLLHTIAGERARQQFNDSLGRNPGAQTKKAKDLVGVTG